MKESGARMFCTGFEFGNDEILRRIKKGIGTDKMREFARKASDAGIRIHGCFMIGGPGEDFGTLMDTFNLIKETGVDRPIFFTYRPLPATDGAKLVAELGGTVDESGWDKIDSLHTSANVDTGKLKPWQIAWFRNFCLAYFNGRRTLRLISKDKHHFFLNLAKWLLRGVKDGVGMQYSLGYFMVCAGKNLLPPF